MKFISLVLITICILSCNSSKNKTQLPKAGEVKLLAIYTDSNGNKIPSIVVRVITVNPKYDSTKGTYEVAVDTIFGAEQRIPLLDSLKQPKLDSLKKPMYYYGYVRVPKESINTHVENIPLDSLTKKK